MDFNKLLSQLFGSKATRDWKQIQPWVDKIKAVSPTIEALSNDELRAKTKELQHNIQSSADELNQQISEIRAKIEDTPIEDREHLSKTAKLFSRKSISWRSKCSNAWTRHSKRRFPRLSPS